MALAIRTAWLDTCTTPEFAQCSIEGTHHLVATHAVLGHDRNRLLRGVVHDYQALDRARIHESSTSGAVSTLGTPQQQEPKRQEYEQERRC